MPAAIFHIMEMISRIRIDTIVNRDSDIGEFSL